MIINNFNSSDPNTPIKVRIAAFFVSGAFVITLSIFILSIPFIGIARLLLNRTK